MKLRLGFVSNSSNMGVNLRDLEERINPSFVVKKNEEKTDNALCCQRGPLRYSCGLKKGHKEPHIAMGSAGNIYETWQ